MLWVTGNLFLHVAQGHDVLGSRQQTKDLVAVLLLGHSDLLHGELLPQGVVAEEVVVHLAGGLQLTSRESSVLLSSYSPWGATTAHRTGTGVVTGVGIQSQNVFLEHLLYFGLAKL